LRGLRNWMSDRSLERRLRRLSPQPSAQLTAAVARSLGPQRRPRVAARVAVTGGLTAAMLGALGAVGGIGYAASAAGQAVHAIKRVVSPQQAVVVSSLSSGGDQYKPGYGWGDDDHNHEGPPGLKKGGTTNKGEFAPPEQLVAVDGGKAGVVSTSITLDEQAHLFISVVDSKGKKVLITQSSKDGGSDVGGKLKGGQSKTINYQVLVPRTIPIKLRVPGSLLKSKETYRIQVIARDPQGNKTTIYLPFAA
jgi:hypothetical protein